MKVAQRAGTHIVPDLRSNWLPFYRPYSFASQPFDCFAENIQFSRSCTAVQPPFLRLPDYFFILSCLSSLVKILRPVFSVFADLFMPPGCCCFVPARFLPPRFLCPKSIRPDVSYVQYREKRKFLETSCASRRKHPHSRRKPCILPPPRAIFSLASSNCFLVPSPMLWYELEGTVAYRPVRFQYIIEYM